MSGMHRSELPDEHIAIQEIGRLKVSSLSDILEAMSFLMDYTNLLVMMLQTA